jgi:hypothetical protein
MKSPTIYCFPASALYSYSEFGKTREEYEGKGLWFAGFENDRIFIGYAWIWTIRRKVMNPLVKNGFLVSRK